MGCDARVVNKSARERGENMTKKLCIVAWFDCRDYFQWFVALGKYALKLGISVSSINASPVHRKVYSDFNKDPYWNPLKEADYVYAYATRRSSRYEPTGISWWSLPQFVKPFMKPEAKMLDQWDDEWVWLSNPNGSWWDLKLMPNPDNHGGPEQFFKDTKILEIADGHIKVTDNPLFEKYTTKPVFRILLPHLFRYGVGRYNENHKGKNLAIMFHSTRSHNIHSVLENVIRPKNYAVTVFNGSIKQEVVDAFRAREKLPVNSEVYIRMEYVAYTDLMWRNCDVGLDNSDGYEGWSRFGMECAISCVPCVGSSNSVHDMFPELYTDVNDFTKQIELIERLRTDKKFYHEMVIAGHKRLLDLLDDEKLCRILLDCFEKVGISKSKVALRNFQPEDTKYNADTHQAHPHP
jgi:hypothetical protein